MMQKILIVLSGILLVSCAGKQPEPLPIRDLMAEVCTEGEGRKSKIYVKNTGIQGLTIILNTHIFPYIPNYGIFKFKNICFYQLTKTNWTKKGEYLCLLVSDHICQT